MTVLANVYIYKFYMTETELIRLKILYIFTANAALYFMYLMKLKLTYQLSDFSIIFNTFAA